MADAQLVKEFAAWWNFEFKGIQCSVFPGILNDLSMSAAMALRRNASLYQRMFGQQNAVSLPADTLSRLQTGTLLYWDIPFLEGAGLQFEADRLKREKDNAVTQTINQRIDESREVQAMSQERNKSWQQMGLLQRLGHMPLSPEQVAANRRRYGISE